MYVVYLFYKYNCYTSASETKVILCFNLSERYSNWDAKIRVPNKWGYMESGLYADHSKSTWISGMLLLTSNPSLFCLQFWWDRMGDFPWDESF